MVVHIYNPTTWEVEAGSLQVQGQPGLHSDTLFQKIKTKQNLGGNSLLVHTKPPYSLSQLLSI
jgi:hypothetical protein